MFNNIYNAQMKRLLLIIIFFYSCDQKTRYSLDIDIVSSDKIYTNNLSEINLRSTVKWAYN